MSTSNILADSPIRAEYEQGEIVVHMKSGRVVRFRASLNDRLAKGTPVQLARIEVSPYGLHWPDLDEDLSFRGLLQGDFGQRRG
jgi:hypothetical protein